MRCFIVEDVVKDVSRETFPLLCECQSLKITGCLLILVEEYNPSPLLEKEDKMIRFNNDYNQTCLPEIMAAIQNLGDQTFPGYGQDDLCHAAVTLLREEIGWEDADIHFMPGATQANFIVHAAALRPIESVICADSGHIAGHEAGSVENTGHQLLVVPCRDHSGKLHADDVRAVAEQYKAMGEPDYMTDPKLVYISQPTEYSGIYTLDELQAIKEVCEDHDMMLFVDGARLAYALGSEDNDVTLWDLAALCDAFTIGGTKCGALFGEAVVLTNDGLKRRFRTYMKQNGAVLAKGWLLGLQFYTFFQNGRYYKLGQKADQQALRLKQAFKDVNLPLFTDSPSNQQFVLLTKAEQEKLAGTFIFEVFGPYNEHRDIVRFCTSWATQDIEIDALISALRRL